MIWDDPEPTVNDHIIGIVEPAGSMAPGSIVDELVQRHDLEEREAKVAVSEAIGDGILVEHPDFDKAYVVAPEFAGNS